MIAHINNRSIPVFTTESPTTYVNDVYPVDNINKSASFSVQANIQYSKDNGHGVTRSISTYDYIYSGVYIVNTLSVNDTNGHIFDFGSFSNDVSIDAYVWNATPYQQNISLINYIGDLDGVSLNYDVVSLEPTEERIVTLSATADGDVTIDGTIRTDYTTTSTPIYVTGSRVLVFIFEQNRSFNEVLEFYTGIQKSTIGEIRHKLRQEPRYISNKSFQVFDEQHALLDYFSKLSMSTRYNVPLWSQQKFFYKSLIAGTSSINYGEVPFFGIENITNVLCYQDKDKYEVLQIDNTSGNTINLRKAVSIDFDYYRIVPLYDAHIPNGFNINNINKYTTFDCEIVTNEIPQTNGSITFSLYNGYYVNNHYHIQGNTREVNQDIEIIDSQTSYFDILENRIYNNDIFSTTFYFTSDELENYKAFLYDCSGMLKPFWLMTYKDEFSFLGFDGANYSKLFISSYNKARSFVNQHVYFIDGSGNRYERKIISCNEISENNFTVVIDSDLPSTINIVNTGFLYLVRFNSDILSLEWQNSRTIKHNATMIRLHYEEGQI